MRVTIKDLSQAPFCHTKPCNRGKKFLPNLVMQSSSQVLPKALGNKISPSRVNNEKVPFFQSEIRLICNILQNIIPYHLEKNKKITRILKKERVVILPTPFIIPITSSGTKWYEIYLNLLQYIFNIFYYIFINLTLYAFRLKTDYSSMSFDDLIILYNLNVSFIRKDPIYLNMR